MLKYRLVFGPVMIAALLVLIVADNQLDRVSLTGTPWQAVFLGRTYLPAGLPLLALIGTLIALGSKELVQIFRDKGIAASRFMVSTAALTGFVLFYIIPYRTDSQHTVAIYGSVLGLLFLLTLVRHSFLRQQTQGIIAIAAVTMFAMIYFGVLPGFYLAIRRWHSAWVIAAILLITKSCDIGAYFTGRMIGRHKLVPWLSPGKTVEGLIGGVVLSTLLSVAFVALADHYDVLGRFTSGEDARAFITFQVPLWYAAAGGMLLGLLGQVGDLTASIFKRDAGIKDSGHSIPGFGGLLDVLDSPILVAPLAYWLLTGAWTWFGS
jgi:phosphatidate cytidylyltransferase